MNGCWIGDLQAELIQDSGPLLGLFEAGFNLYTQTALRVIVDSTDKTG